MMNGTASNAKRVKFELLDATAFQHPLDKQSTDGLKMLAGFDVIVARVIEFGFERLRYIYNISSSVQVTEQQFPKLHAMLRESCAILDMPEPELYVQQSPLVNAVTSGHNQPFITLYTGLLELLDDDEVMAVIAHELGHIKCGHVLYLMMAELLRLASAQLTQVTLGIGAPVAFALQAALVSWRRRAELSCDRASLLVMQDTRPLLTTMTKLAGGTRRMADQLSPDEFLKQARLFDEIDQKGWIDQFYRGIAESDFNRFHPFIVERVKEFDLWSASPEYADILAGNYTRRERKYQIKVQAEA